MKQVYILLGSMIVAGVLAGVVISNCTLPVEQECEHIWTVGASQEYAQKLLTDGWTPPIYYYTCVACGKEIGSTCELDTSVAGNMFTKAAEIPDIVIDTDSGVDLNDFFTTDPNLIITFDAWIPEPTDLIFYDKVTFKWVDGKFDVIYDANDLTEAAEAFFFGIAPYLNAHIKDAAERLNERVSQ